MNVKIQQLFIDRKAALNKSENVEEGRKMNLSRELSRESILIYRL